MQALMTWSVVWGAVECAGVDDMVCGLGSRRVCRR